MATETYDYSAFATNPETLDFSDTLSGVIKTQIATALDGIQIGVVTNKVDFIFAAALSAPEKTTLDNIVATQTVLLSGSLPTEWKSDVRVATTASITLSGLQTVDGVSLVAGDRVLVKDQGGTRSDPANGIYEAQTGAWNRAPDADMDDEVNQCMAVLVEEGNGNIDSAWILRTSNPITLGTTALEFTPLNLDWTVDQGAKNIHDANIVTAAPSAGIGGGNSEGSATSLSRSDHDHALRTTTGPTDLTIGAIADGEVLTRSGTTIIGGGLAALGKDATAGSVIYSDGSAGLAEDNANLFWDDVAKELSLGNIEVTGTVQTALADGPAILNESASGSNPTLIPERNSLGDGIGHTAGQIHIIVGGTNAFGVTAGLYVFKDGSNFVFGTTTGTKIGNTTSDKLAFWNTTPVVQPAHIADPTGGATVDAEARTAIDAILAQLATTGLQAAS